VIWEWQPLDHADLKMRGAAALRVTLRARDHLGRRVDTVRGTARLGCAPGRAREAAWPASHIQHSVAWPNAG
jgi:hypothetical protein